MSALKTMTLDELRETPLTKEQKQAVRSAAKKAKSGKTTEDPDCPKMTKEELAEFRPWREVHPEWYKPKKTEIHMRVDTDVLEWYKSQGKGYQTKMNAVLRTHAFG